MMKRKFLAVVLPIIGCATVVGSGFGAWYFGEVTGVNANNSFQLGIDVSEEVSDATGALSISSTNSTALDNKVVMLDQGGPNNDDVDSGISIVASGVTGQGFNIADHKDEISDVNYEFTVSYNGSTTSLSKIYDAGMKVNVSVTIDFIDEDLIKFIELQKDLKLQVTEANPTGTAESKTFTPTTVSEGADNSFVASIDITDPKGDTTDGTWKFKIGMSTTLEGKNYKNAFLKYKTPGVEGSSSVGKPNAKGEPDAMRTALSGAGIKVTTVATLA